MSTYAAPESEAAADVPAPPASAEESPPALAEGMVPADDGAEDTRVTKIDGVQVPVRLLAALAQPDCAFGCGGRGLQRILVPASRILGKKFRGYSGPSALPYDVVCACAMAAYRMRLRAAGPVPVLPLPDGGPRVSGPRNVAKSVQALEERARECEAGIERITREHRERVAAAEARAEAESERAVAISNALADIAADREEKLANIAQLEAALDRARDGLGSLDEHAVKVRADSSACEVAMLEANRAVAAVKAALAGGLRRQQAELDKLRRRIATKRAYHREELEAAAG